MPDASTGASQPPAGLPSADALIGQILCGRSVEWPYGPDPAAVDRFLDAARLHDVQPLLHQRLRAADWVGRWPIEVAERLAEAAGAQAALECLRHEELAHVLHTLSDRGLSPLLMKGAALAHTHYASPALRPRGDTDLLVRPEARVAARGALEDLGYEPVNVTSGALVSYEFTMKKTDRWGVEHLVDVHWRVNNRQAFAWTLSHDELAAAAVNVAVLGARVLAPAHALLLACMHRVTHFGAPFFDGGRPRFGDRLIWLYDIHLLASAMPRTESTEFARLAVDRGMAGVCLDGLSRAADVFATELPADLVAGLIAASKTEGGASLLAHGQLAAMAHDLRTLPRWRDRLRLVLEHLLPPADYMRRKYPAHGRAWLPWLYLRRAAVGGWGLLWQAARLAQSADPTDAAGPSGSGEPDRTPPDGRRD
ncbi:MAG: nucleotidyltransferase family protein [Vicinamibacterales bacterium]|jgi:hypothetical protein|nr:hypothetical protein [Acidobacteriota bacterium]MDP6372326.1 nucleotidyltransferase family protein [Vicinamibacterales bacterium]MDP6608627.1 nucleotidyltransferase family protein [Vicinamibacterales bacterium]HAK54405.1 hypothetical protein [Acidobacteriota bacterium]|tara:strand:- start:2651 stop:3919 length:1269 start_codon:yes stop_codon:yes gene_type:complete